MPAGGCPRLACFYVSNSPAPAVPAGAPSGQEAASPCCRASCREQSLRALLPDKNGSPAACGPAISEGEHPYASPGCPPPRPPHSGCNPVSLPTPPPLQIWGLWCVPRFSLETASPRKRQGDPQTPPRDGGQKAENGEPGSPQLPVPWRFSPCTDTEHLAHAGVCLSPPGWSPEG